MVAPDQGEAHPPLGRRSAHLHDTRHTAATAYGPFVDVRDFDLAIV